MPDAVASSSDPTLPTGPLSGEVTPRRAAMDVGIQVVGRAGNLVLGIVVTALIARGLGSSRYGEWTTILLVPSLLAYLNDLGLHQVAVRQASATDDPRWLGALITARAALAVPVVLFTFASFLLIGARGDMLMAGAIVSLQGLLAVPAAYAAVFQVRVRNDLTMVALTLNSLLWTGAAAVILARGGGLVALAIALIGLQAFTTTLQALIALRQVRVPIRGATRLWRPLARIAIPLSIATVLTVAYGKIDGLLVYHYRGTVEAGLYGAAYRLLDQAAFIPMSLTVTLLPLLSRAWPEDRERARRLLQLAVELLAAAGLFAVAFAFAAPEASILFLYGEEFAPAADALPPLMIAFAVICLGYALGMYTLVLDLASRFAVYALIALILNVAANLWLLPDHSYVAAAWITVATEVLVSGAILPHILRRLEMRLTLAPLVKVAVSAALAGGVATLLDRSGVQVLLTLAVAAAVHVGSLIALGALDLGTLRALARKQAP